MLFARLSVGCVCVCVYIYLYMYMYMYIYIYIYKRTSVQSSVSGKGTAFICSHEYLRIKRCIMCVQKRAHLHLGLYAERVECGAQRHSPGAHPFNTHMHPPQLVRTHQYAHASTSTVHARIIYAPCMQAHVKNAFKYCRSRQHWHHAVRRLDQACLWRARREPNQGLARLRTHRKHASRLPLAPVLSVYLSSVPGVLI
jgi:hypothetical protein